MSIKDVQEEQIDSIMGAIGAVLKAIVSVAKCVDNVKKDNKKGELNGNAVV